MQRLQAQTSSTRRSVLKGVGAGAAAFGTATMVSGTTSGANESDGQLVIVYDDGRRADYTKAFPVHEEYNVPGCTAVCPGLMGSTVEWLNPGQLGEMYDAGWEVMSHTLKHRALAEIPIRGDIEEGDTEIVVQSSLHGEYAGDPLVIFDENTEVEATSAGQNDTDEDAVLVLEAPIEESFEAGNGYETWVRYTDDFTEQILAESKSQIEEWGYGPVTAYVHTYNRYDGYVSEVLPEYYPSTPGAHGDPLNPLPIADPLDLGRKNFQDEKMTEEEIGEFLDTVSSEPYLGILYAHSYVESFTQDRIANVFEMCRDRDIEVVTFQEALLADDAIDLPGSDRPDNSSSNQSEMNGNDSVPSNATTTEEDDPTFFERLIATIRDLLQSIFS